MCELARQDRQKAFTAVLNRLREVEGELGRLDAVAGDGDHGSAMVRGMSAARDAASGIEDLATALQVSGEAFADSAGGSSGVLYGQMAVAAASTWRESEEPSEGSCKITTCAVATALRAALAAVQELGGAQPGDKTLVDALAPFVASMSDSAENAVPLADAWARALERAQAGATATAKMVSRKGRSARLGDRSLGHQDPGATSLICILEVLSGGLPARSSAGGAASDEGRG